MSYWFEEPHTLVLARARIGLRNSRKSDRLRAESETASAERALVGDQRGAVQDRHAAPKISPLAAIISFQGSVKASNERESVKGLG